MDDRRKPPVYSRRLRQARQTYGLSQRALGVKAGISESVASSRINRYETGVHQPHLSIQQLLARALQVPLAFFYAEDDELARMILDYGRTRDAEPGEPGMGARGERQHAGAGHGRCPDQ